MIETRAARETSLASLVAALEGARAAGETGGEITSVQHDSRAVSAGTLFVALRGTRVDGHAFALDAVAAGARAVVVDERFAGLHGALSGVTTIVVPDTRAAMSRLAAAYYGFPSAALNVVGITGTNGKTTTTHMLSAILERSGVLAGRIGTLGAALGGAMWSLDNTTPLALELQAMLAEMRERGAAAVVMEVSSHALALGRVADVEFATGVLTNLTRDHLDFHPDFDAYAAAKRTLFERSRTLVFNADDAFGAAWASQFTAEGKPTTTYGLNAAAGVRASDVVADADGTEFRVAGKRFRLCVPGRFNVYNALAALCVARGFGVEDLVSAEAIEAFEGVPGRMERISRDGVDVLVDFAHTPDALAAVLGAAREMARRRLILVFGCGGDRDRGKRPEMGRIASEGADLAIVTSDNPRREHPQTIVAEIVAGAVAGRAPAVELDRRSAIRYAIAEAAAGDVVVIAGKGHETYQVVGERAHHFDDRDEVRAALAERARGDAR